MRKLTLLAALAGALTLTPSALAAAPTATTGAATAVTSTTAAVNGSVDSGKEQTTYHFQYGKTTAYGASTTETSVHKGNRASSVSADLDTLAPSKTYHYRLVATNPSGTAPGADMTFTTLAEGQAPPGGNAITIDAKPKSVVFGHGTTLSGQLVGPDNANVALTLQIRRPTIGETQFSDGGNVTTDAAGNYSISLAPLALEEYRVVARTKPVVTSPVQRVTVRWALTLSLSDSTPKRGERVRFSGQVTPADDGARALIQRRTKSGKFRTVTTALLKHVVTNPEEFSRSSYSKRLRIKRSGIYRVRVPGSGGRSTVTTKKRRIRVH